jgi:cation transport regulator ChaB
MRYQTTNDLPPTIRDVLPEEAQKLYLDGYNRAWQEYDEDAAIGQSRETLAHQQGWLAVRHQYVQDQGTGLWHRRGEAEGKEQEPEGLWAKVKSLF